MKIIFKNIKNIQKNTFSVLNILILAKKSKTSYNENDEDLKIFSKIIYLIWKT